MGFLPDKQERPPAVDQLRRAFRDSWVGRFVTRRRTLAAVAVALVAVFKVGRIGLAQLAWALRHPDEVLAWLGEHWLLVLVVSAVVFLVAFVSARLGIDWLADDTRAAPSRGEPGSDRHDRATSHLPRGGF